MTIAHHISDDLLLDYAAGNLAEGWSLALATHLALCPFCRDRMSLFEAIGGRMLDDTLANPPTPALPDPADPDPSDSAALDSAWSAVMTKIHTGTPATAIAPAASAAVHANTPTIPQPLRDYIGGDIDAIKWRALGKGPSQFKIKTGDGETQVRLLRIPAGQPVPEHSHGGRELTLVLSGSFRDGETVFSRGDLEDADGTLTHQPTATPEADCICLAVTDAPLRFRSWLIRAVQPFLGI